MGIISFNSIGRYMRLLSLVTLTEPELTHLKSFNPNIRYMGLELKSTGFSKPSSLASQSGRTALGFAAQRGHGGCVRALLASGCNTDDMRTTSNVRMYTSLLDVAVWV